MRVVRREEETQGLEKWLILLKQSQINGRPIGRNGTEVYRRKWVIHIEGLTREKVNGSSCKVGVDASKVEITELKLNKDRQNILERKAAHKAAGKYTEKDVNLD